MLCNVMWVLAVVVCLSVCLSVCVCLYDTRRYCIKTAKRRITQAIPRDSSQMTNRPWNERGHVTWPILNF